MNRQQLEKNQKTSLGELSKEACSGPLCVAQWLNANL